MTAASTTLSWMWMVTGMVTSVMTVRISSKWLVLTSATTSTTAQLSLQTLNQWRTWTTACVCLLKAVYDITKINRSILVILLVGPALDPTLLNATLFKWVQESIDLLVNLIALRFILGDWHLENIWQHIDRPFFLATVLCRLNFTLRCTFGGTFLRFKQVINSKNLVVESGDNFFSFGVFGVGPFWNIRHTGVSSLLRKPIRVSVNYFILSARLAYEMNHVESLFIDLFYDHGNLSNTPNKVCIAHVYQHIDLKFSHLSIFLRFCVAGLSFNPISLNLLVLWVFN